MMRVLTELQIVCLPQVCVADCLWWLALSKLSQVMHSKIPYGSALIVNGTSTSPMTCQKSWEIAPSQQVRLELNIPWVGE